MLAQLDGFNSRLVKADAAPVQENCYATVWQPTTAAAKKSGKAVLIGELKGASTQLEKISTDAPQVALVVTALQQGERDVLMLAALQNALAAVQAALASKKPLVLALLTSGTQRTSAVDVIRPTHAGLFGLCLLYTSPSPRDRQKSRMPSSA